MNTTQKFKIISALIFATAAASGIAHADNHRMDRCAKDPATQQACMQEHQSKRQEHLFKKLNATDAQKKQIQTIMAANQPKHEASMQQMKQMHEQMKALREANVPKDDPKATALRDQMKAFHDAKHAEMEQTHAKIRAVLTPEQAKTFDAMKAKHEQQRMQKGPRQGEHKGMRGGPDMDKAGRPAPEDMMPPM